MKSAATPTTRRTHVSDTTTEGVRVVAQPAYMPEQSQPDNGRFLFAYRITIENTSDRSVQLLTRHWVIIDADGHREDVHGPGVVGETPIIPPGESHTYSSFCPLQTSWGTMEGAYHMRDNNGRSFEVRIGRFVLAR